MIGLTFVSSWVLGTFIVFDNEFSIGPIVAYFLSVNFQIGVWCWLHRRRIDRMKDNKLARSQAPIVFSRCKTSSQVISYRDMDESASSTIKFNTYSL